MRSMTGFGRGVAESSGLRATVDVRAVNHRFLDVKLRGTSVAPPIEEAIAGRIRTAIERGAVAVSVHLAHKNGATGMRIDIEVADRAYRELAQLASRLALPKPELALLLPQPGVVVLGDDRSGAGSVDGDDQR